MSIDAAKERILREVDLATFIGQSVQLTRRSGNQVGLCPFHDEKSPSFTVFAKNYYCFGCHASGDVITFAMETRGLGFIDALKFLAAQHGIEVGDLSSRKNSPEDRARSIMFRSLQTAQEYFCHHLGRPEAEAHRRYLEGRGFTPEQISRYGFGFAPEGGGLTSALIKRGVAIADIEKASLGYPAKYPKPGQEGYDFFQSRITIPIKDSFGRIIGFGGRTVVDHPAKYKNSRETDLFQKSRTLFGADLAATAARKQNRVVVTEGYMDAMQLWAHGIDETVAILGTALTAHHMRALSRMAHTVYLVFDGDKAGIRAGLKSVEAALTVPGLNIKVLSLPDGHDPDSYVAAFGRDAFLEAMQGTSEELFQFAIRHTLAGQGGMQVTQAVAETILPWLRTITDPITRSFLLTKLAQTTGIDQATLAAQLKAQPNPERAGGQHAQPGESPAATPQRPQAGPGQLGRLGVELMAQLYFLPKEFNDTAQLASATALVLAEHEEAKRLAAKMSEVRVQQGCLADLDGPLWLGDDADIWLAFFAQLRSRRAFFENNHPGEAVAKITTQAELTKVKNDISMLKSQLAAEPSSLEILAALGQLTGRRLELEKNLT